MSSDSNVFIPQINLQEISDDEALGEEVADDAEGDLLTKVLHDNDNTGAEDAAKAYNARTVQSISHDTKPFQSGGNVASVDEYEHDSSDEEVTDRTHILLIIQH